VQAVIARGPAMIHQNHTPRWLPCPNHTSNNLQTSWIRKETGGPPPIWHRLQTPESTLESPASLPGTLTALTRKSFGAQCREILNLPAEYAYSHTSLTCVESSTLDASAQECKQHKHFSPDMLPDEGKSTG
jgi:hypothetical protein